MRQPEIIDVRNLFPELYDELLFLLKSIDNDKWFYPTSSSKWNVKDIVAHLIDGDLRRISFQRDKMIPPKPKEKIIDSSQLTKYINDLNNIWTEVSKRLSPEVLIDLLSYTSQEIPKLFNSLDLRSEALFGVSWAGEEKSENWFDIAREYTERWYHQQQIREAINIPLLNKKKWIYPLMDTFMRALPFLFNLRFKNPDLKDFYIDIFDLEGDKWILKFEDEWVLYKGILTVYKNGIKMDSDTAWRLFSKNIKKEKAKNSIEIVGDKILGEIILDLTTFIK